ncbi:cytochrome c oxidase assembly factor 1 homolog isoform X2 [Centropristis striata]|uniref:cytochrome c oxidase assembly factor 1 homolog isoform X2 n=1 Tax=Centropristis striata TaxID=184440 RepID=UPI0027E20F6C|nr:cytochrome c oxidase assembly factor 1 homolog isoform X2 [Centropristis striata]
MYPQCVTFTEVNAASYSCPAAVAQVKEAKMRVSNSQLQKLTIFTTVLTGAGVGTMYYLMQKKFVESDYHRLALQKLEACPLAMERLGAPPLKIKIPVTGSETGGYLYTSSIRDPDTNRWSVKQAVLQLREGQIIDLLDPPPPAALQTQEGLETGTWH